MNNNAALGYMIAAAKRMKLDEQTIDRVLAAMYVEMDEKSEEEAEQVYKDF